MNFAALLLASTLAASPAFLAKFPTLKLPLGVDDRLKPAAALGARDAIPNLLEPISQSPASNTDGLSGLRALWIPAAQAQTRALLGARDAGSETLAFSAIGKVVREDSLVLLVREARSSDLTAETNVYLLTFTPAGAFVDGTRLAGAGVANEAMSSRIEARLLADGTFSRSSQFVLATHDLEGAPDDMTIRSESKGRIGAGGKVDPGERHYLGWSGVFVDAASKEVLHIYDAQGVVSVFYQSGPGKPPQRLKVQDHGKNGALLVHFAKSPKGHVLSLEEGGEQLYCANPDGKQQTFVRGW
ncbi:MAG: hypothetical protein H6Q89_2324 [Myxococcaceae bacterium]|nr:hypothetical protein [Myxococcaceae bacterium]